MTVIDTQFHKAVLQILQSLLCNIQTNTTHVVETQNLMDTPHNHHHIVIIMKNISVKKVPC